MFSQQRIETPYDFEFSKYGPVQGRFISPDPSRLSILPSNPQTWNRYSYFYNNPLA